jgi:hypothetical protein
MTELIGRCCSIKIKKLVEELQTNLLVFMSNFGNCEYPSHVALDQAYSELF